MSKYERPVFLYFAKASKTLEAPVKLLKDADKVAAKIPMAIKSGQKLMCCMYR